MRVDCVQVVHLFQELRKLMGDDFMVKDLNSQDPAATMLRGRRPFQALTAADEQARQRSLADNSAVLQVHDLVHNHSCLPVAFHNVCYYRYVSWLAWLWCAA